MIIAIDFDGTIVEHRFPEIGSVMPYAFTIMKQLQAEGHQLILWTCRNDIDPANGGRKVLSEAVTFCKDNGIEFDAINDNVPGLGFNPKPKIYADLYFDDRALNEAVDWLWFYVHVKRETANKRKKPS